MVCLIIFSVSALPVVASMILTHEEVNAKARALAQEYGVQLGITPPLDFDFAAAEQALSTSRSSIVIETYIPDAESPATFANSASTLEISCTKKYWRLGIYT